ncbi:hypothetical protein F3J37_12795 [Pantoea sp. Al-1710]|uniref:Uncharacterized protein n=1 Tax=Candidatus Pantoea communis TaxID=2608354 RepID=A0ABX0RSY4_9GAMM|nr:hypothetical protein [Pantoea communis]
MGWFARYRAGVTELSWSGYPRLSSHFILSQNGLRAVFFSSITLKRDPWRKKAAKPLKSGEFAASTHSSDAAIMRRLFFRNVFGTLLVTGIRFCLQRPSRLLDTAHLMCGV